MALQTSTKRPSSLRNSSVRSPGGSASLPRWHERRDGVLEAVALDEAHGVKRPAVGVAAQAVDRHDTGMLQPAGDLRLQQKARLSGWSACCWTSTRRRSPPASLRSSIATNTSPQPPLACSRRWRKRIEPAASPTCAVVGNPASESFAVGSAVGGESFEGVSEPGGLKAICSRIASGRRNSSSACRSLGVESGPFFSAERPSRLSTTAWHEVEISEWTSISPAWVVDRLSESQRASAPGSGAISRHHNLHWILLDPMVTCNSPAGSVAGVGSVPRHVRAELRSCPLLDAGSAEAKYRGPFVRVLALPRHGLPEGVGVPAGLSG